MDTISLERLQLVSKLPNQITMEERIKDNEFNKNKFIYIICIEYNGRSRVCVGKYLGAKYGGLANEFAIYSMYHLASLKYINYTRPVKISFIVNNVDKNWSYFYLYEDVVLEYLNKLTSKPNPTIKPNPTKRVRKNSLVLDANSQLDIEDIDIEKVFDDDILGGSKKTRKHKKSKKKRKGKSRKMNHK